MAQLSSSSISERSLKNVYPVSRLVREARVMLEGGFPLLWVEGEISNLAMPASGHIYFSLKDEAAQVRCAMFKNRNRQLRFTPENGMQVLMRVRVTLYEGRGEFQLVVEHMEESGSGALQRAYEALKHRLGEEGLFDQENKKKLPVLPQSIGIVSSSSGAAVHDILTVLQRRFSAIPVVLYPVAVQGVDSASQIIKAITLANKRQECDLLIVGRGGGSLEDLWSFNDEQLARTIFASEIPVISAIGHEVDFTIADFVADVRAPTPSAAAELAVPNSKEWLDRLQVQCRRLALLISHRLQREQQNLKYLKQRLPRPEQRLNEQAQRLDSIAERLKQAVLHFLELKTAKQKLINQRLKSCSPLSVVQQVQIEIGQTAQRLLIAMQQQLQQRELRLSEQIRTLGAVSPLKTLERGYSITTQSRTGQLVERSDQVLVGDSIGIRLYVGELTCEVKEIKK